MSNKRRRNFEFSDDWFGVILGVGLFVIPTFWIQMGDAGELLMQSAGILIGGFSLMRIFLGE